MTGEIHPLASHHLPFYLAIPGQTDTLMIATGIFLLAVVVLIGVFYFKLHALPEHLSHGRASKIQFEIVSVLALLALFTHNNLFWVAALLLAMVRIPDFEAPINVIAKALARMAGLPTASDDEPVADGPAPRPDPVPQPVTAPPPAPVATAPIQPLEAEK